MIETRNLPTSPKSIWAMLAKLSWSNANVVRAHHIRFRAAVQGVVAPISNGTAVDALLETVAARHYFLVRRITGSVEQDVAVIPRPEQFNALFVSLQITDVERKSTPIFRTPLRMGALAGVGTSPQPTPLLFDEVPLSFLPGAKILVTFRPLAGLTAAAHTLTGLTTRLATIDMHGILVAQEIAERLLAMNPALGGSVESEATP